MRSSIPIYGTTSPPKYIKWYAGETRVASLDNEGKFFIHGEFTSDQPLLTICAYTANVWQLSCGSAVLGFVYNGTQLSYINNCSGAYVATSDRRLKSNIEYIDNTESLDIVCKLKPTRYNLRGNKTVNIGVIAQEVQEIHPTSVHV